jgi:hypothetical protein
MSKRISVNFVIFLRTVKLKRKNAKNKILKKTLYFSFLKIIKLKTSYIE